MDLTLVRRLAPYVLGLAACLLMGWYAFVRGVQVPVLGAADLGFHELGHLLFAWAPRRLDAFMGSGTQVLVPLGLAAYFAFVRREKLSLALMLAWAGTAAQNVSVYVGDAPYQRLELIGGLHDWAFLLSGAYGWARPLAALAWGSGLLLWALGGALCAAGLLPDEPRPQLAGTKR